VYCECFFCDEGRFSLNESIGLPGASSIIYEDSNIFITPDVAPLDVGHFLIITKEHFNSVANVPENVYASIEKGKQLLINILCSNYTYLFFEHGAVIQHMAGGCIDHAHVHAMLLSDVVDLDKQIQNSGFVLSSREEATWELLQSFAKEHQPYLFYETKGIRWAYRVGALPHQFFRILVANQFSKGFNWRQQCRTESSQELFHKTMQFAEPFKEYISTLHRGEEFVI
jgi:diadenosine tetraphosphate (Ap4A) HIT family hydrolase